LALGNVSVAAPKRSYLTMPIDIANLWRYDLRSGKTDHPANGACLFDAGMWLVYGKIGDDPPCSCPVIRAYSMGLNDRMLDAERQLLKPFILRVVGNRDPAAEAARCMYIVAETARRVVPLAFDEVLPLLAAEIRALPDDYMKIMTLMGRARDAATAVTTRASNYAAYSVAYVSANAAATAATSAIAATDRITAAHRAAAAAAYVASNFAANAAIADAALSAALSTAKVADTVDAGRGTAYTAYTAARAAHRAWSEAISILDGALRIGRQSPEFDEDEVSASIRAFERARLAA
jgi:hypothetical protein